MLKKRALITGASAGIGEAFARAYAERGHDLILIARREDRLIALAADLTEAYQVDVLVVAVDLSLPGAAEQIEREVNCANLQIDVLVNNAGYGSPGTFVDTSWDDHLAVHQVMISAVTELCYRLLPPMYERRHGMIINVASMAGLIPATAGHTLYGAVKAWMIRFSEALADEARPHGVRVIALCPGFTFSEFHDVTGTREQVDALPNWLWMTADAVAESALSEEQGSATVVVPGMVNRGLLLLVRWLPGSLIRWLIRRESVLFRKTDLN